MQRARLAAALCAVMALAPPANALGADSSKPLRTAVTVDEIMEHERALQAIADMAGGTRASGTPGGAATVEYLVDELEDEGYQPKVQAFEFPFFQELAMPTLERTAPAPRTYVVEDDFATMTYSGSGDVTAAVHAVDVQIPPGPQPNSSTSGCEAADFAGFPAGAIALIQRGTCTFATKASNAQTAGASAVLIFNEGQPGRTEPVAGTLGAPGFNVPVLGTSFAVGGELVGLLRAGQAVTLHVTTSTLVETRTAHNVIADSRRGDPARTIVVGAHQDSVTAGPGINDNGSGTSTLLAIADELGTGGKPRNRVRFIFFGAEEFGLLGSEHHVAQLTSAARGEIKAMLNFDMVGSPNYVRFVLDGDGSEGGAAGPDGSAAIERMFHEAFAHQGLASDQSPLSGRSDYQPFADAGIPVGGLFTGADEIKTPQQAVTYGGTAGEPYDACYHKACDTLANLSRKALDEMSDAAADVIYRLSRARGPLLLD